MARSEFIKRKRREDGLTLIELMVSLLVAAILGIAIIGVLGFGIGRDRANSNATAVNDNARAALTLITRDVASAGFLFGATQSQCSITLAYDNGFPSPYQTLYPIWEAQEVFGSALPFPDPNIATETYPTSTFPSSDTAAPGIAQVLLITSAPSATSFIANTSAPLYIVQFGTTQSGSGSGSLSSTQLPTNTLSLNSTVGIQPGDTAYLQVPMNGGTVCIRVPIVSTGTSTGQGTSYIDSKPSQYMPSNGYQDFQPQIPASYGTLNNGDLLHSRLLNLGLSNYSLEIQEYWIDETQPFPVLMRDTFSALTDSLLYSEAIAPGVVSLQVLFGTIPTGSPAGTPITWKTWANVAATDEVESADVALVSRTLHPDLTYTAPQTIVVPQPASGLSSPDMFLNYTRLPSEVHDHFSVYTVNLLLRNIVWE